MGHAGIEIDHGNLAAGQANRAIGISSAIADVGQHEAPCPDLLASLICAALIVGLALGEADGIETAEVDAGLPTNAIVVRRTFSWRAALAIFLTIPLVLTIAADTVAAVAGPATILRTTPLLALLAFPITTIAGATLAVFRAVHGILARFAIAVAALRTRAITIVGAVLRVLTLLALAVATLRARSIAISGAVIMVLTLLAFAVATLWAGVFVAVLGAELERFFAVAFAVTAEGGTLAAVQRTVLAVLLTVARAIATQGWTTTAIGRTGGAILPLRTDTVATIVGHFLAIFWTERMRLAGLADPVPANKYARTTVLGAEEAILGGLANTIATLVQEAVGGTTSAVLPGLANTVAAGPFAATILRALAVGLFKLAEPIATGRRRGAIRQAVRRAFRRLADAVAANCPNRHRIVFGGDIIIALNAPVTSNQQGVIVGAATAQ